MKKNIFIGAIIGCSIVVIITSIYLLFQKETKTDTPNSNGAKETEQNTVKDISIDDKIITTLTYPLTQTEAQLCQAFDEKNIYSMDKYKFSQIPMSHRLYTVFQHEYDQIMKENKGEVKFDQDGLDYLEISFTEEEVKNMYQAYFGPETNFYLTDFHELLMKGTKQQDGYLLHIYSGGGACAGPMKQVETKLTKASLKGNYLYVDYKIRFLDSKDDMTTIYQDRQFQKVVKENISNSELEQTWNLNYQTYRYVFEKQNDGNYYFIEGYYQEEN